MSYGTIKRIAALLLFLLLAAAFAAVPAQVQASSHGKKPSAVKISNFDCQTHADYASTVCTFTTNVPTKASVAVGPDRSDVVAPQTNNRLSTTHSFGFAGLAPLASYVALATATPKTGKPAKQWSLFTAKPAPSASGTLPQPVPSTGNGETLVNGKPAFLLAAQFDSNNCTTLQNLQANIAWGANVVQNGIWGCPSRSDLLAAIAGKAWFTASLDPQAPHFGPPGDPIVQPGFVGWAQPSEPETYLQPGSVPDKPSSGLTFVDFNNMFWSGEYPAYWDGNGNPPAWGPATTAAYFAKADALGLERFPFSAKAGTYCPSDTPDHIYTGLKSLVASSHKPAIVWTFDQMSNCNVLSPTEVTTQWWLGLEGGASGIGFVPRWGQVTANLMTPLTQTANHIKALAPCLLTGTNVPVEGSSPDVKARACRYGGQVYILATNSGNASVTAGLRVGTKAGTATVLWEGRTLKMPATGISDKFVPLQTHVYRVKLGKK